MEDLEIIDRRVSFNSGEISPWLDPRIDLDKYRSSCSRMKNMLPLPYGGAFRRPGTAPIGYTYDSASRAFLYPFTAGNGTTWVLEFTDLLLRIWTTGTSPALVQDGGSDLEIVTPYTTAQLRTLHFAQLNDLLFINHRNHPPHILSRDSATSWSFRPFEADYPALLEVNTTDITVGPSVSAPAGPAAWDSSTTYSAGDRVTHTFGGVNHTFASRYDSNLGKDPALTSKYSGGYKGWWFNLGPTASIGSTPTYSAGKRVTLTASDAIFSSDMVNQKWVLEYDQANLTKTVDITAATAGDYSGQLYVLGAWSAALTATTTGSSGFSVQVLIQRSYDGDNWETIAEMAGNFSDVQQLLSGAEEKPCFLRLEIEAKSGTLPTDYTARLSTTTARQKGMVKIISYLSTTTVRALVIFPIPSAAGNTTRWYQDAWGGDNGWPAAMTIHEGRLYFAGTQTRPTTLWGSRVDDFYDFRLDTPTDAAVSYTIASPNTSRIRWIVSSDDLLIGTKVDEWVLARRNADDIPRVRRQSTIGSDRKQALLINDSVLYVQTDQRKLREFSWNSERNRYYAQDLNLLAEHLGDKQFVEIAAATNPHTTIWLVTENGKLCSCLYDREQNITGWADHDTDGDIESVCIVPGSAGADDEIWLAVRRTINGTDARFLERLNPNGISGLKTAADTTDIFFMDCAVLSVAAAGTITGGDLAALEGQEVDILCDGIYRGTFTVTSGAIDISADPFTGVVIAGLAYSSVLQPTFMEFDDPRKPSKAFKKRITRCILELYKTRGAEITGNEFRDYVAIQDGLSTSETDLFSGLVEVYVQADTERQTTPRIRQIKPFPLSVLSITTRYELGTS